MSARIERLRAAVSGAGVDALIVTHPPNIRYLTGLNASAGAVLVTGTDCVLIVDSRYLEVATLLTHHLSGLRVRLASAALDVAIAEELRSSGVRQAGVEAAYLPLARYHRLAALLGDGPPTPIELPSTTKLVATEHLVERLRVIKDAGELTTMREAARRLSRVASRAREFVVAGRSEAGVAALVDAAVRDAGFERPAFDTIVASGPNSALPHSRPTSRILMEGEGVVLDFGGIYDGYCVDLTRTLHLGPPGAGFRRVFQAVREAHAAAIAAVKPGAYAADIDGAARRVLARHGLLEAFGHGTGHGLGLEVHEDPRISPLASPRERVEAGMVFTVEPGAYLPGSGGVRIEDDVLVTESGCELLTDVAVEL
ncbi:MAG: Xaa-Pro peptidase family protein [Vicinamibacterales bacterium]